MANDIYLKETVLQLQIPTALAPTKQSATDALLNFQDNGTGWNNPGLAVLIGQVTAMYTLVGSDSAAHMAEEIREASVVVPRAMWWSFVANVPPTIVVLVTMAAVLLVGVLGTPVKMEARQVKDRDAQA